MSTEAEANDDIEHRYATREEKEAAARLFQPIAQHILSTDEQVVLFELLALLTCLYCKLGDMAGDDAATIEADVDNLLANVKKNALFYRGIGVLQVVEHPKH